MQKGENNREGKGKDLDFAKGKREKKRPIERNRERDRKENRKNEKEKGKNGKIVMKERE